MNILTIKKNITIKKNENNVCPWQQKNLLCGVINHTQSLQNLIVLVNSVCLW